MIEGMVSCIIPTYRRSDTLERAISSALNQTYENIEVLVVDDNNPDDEYSLKVQSKISKFKDTRVRYIKQEKHINGAVARNVGIQHARGEFIAFLDDDDEWLPTKIEKQLKTLKNNPEYGGVSCLYECHSEGIMIRKCVYYTSNELHRKVLERSVAVQTSTIILKKKCLDETGYFDESMLRHQDLQLLLDFLIKYKIFVLHEYLVIIHTDNAGNRPNLENFIAIKSHFFNKMRQHIDRYNGSIKKRIYAAHYFEIVFLAVKEKKLSAVLKYLFKIGLNIRAYYDLYKRYTSRIKN